MRSCKTQYPGRPRRTKTQDSACNSIRVSNHAYQTVSVRFVTRHKHVLVALVIGRTKEFFQCLCSFPSVVVRDLGRDVVGDVCLSNTVENVSANGTQEVTINGGKGTTRESPLVGRVVGEDRVGVLKEGDEDEPVINPQVGDTVDGSDFFDTSLRSPEGKSSKDKYDTNVGPDDLPVLAGLEDK